VIIVKTWFMIITERGGAGGFSCNTSFLADRAFVGEIAEPCSAIVAVRAFEGELAEPRSAIVAIRAFASEIAEPCSAIVAVRVFVGEERSCSKVFTFEIASCIERLDEYKEIETYISNRTRRLI
jgi:hypothetical protein